MKWIMDDGGRAAAGFKKKKVGDCGARALAIASGMPYAEAHQLMDEAGLGERVTKGRRRHGRSTGDSGVYKATFKRIMKNLGWKWTPTMQIGQGCKVHLKADELPKGRLIVALSRHWVAVIDGVIHDICDPSRRETRCVYGYWSR